MKSIGFMMFAFNNEQHDYMKQAIFTAKRLNEYDDLPITIVTDTESLEKYKDKSYHFITIDPEGATTRLMDRTDRDTKATWKNIDRYKAYELSPYDETLVIDTDFVVNETTWGLISQGRRVSFMCHRNVSDITNSNSFEGDRYFGQFKMPHYWATVIYFKKDNFSKLIFENWKMVKEHYKFYSELYKFKEKPYRNDYALSIALLISYGHVVDDIPSFNDNLLTISPDANVVLENVNPDLFHDRYIITYNDQSNNKKRTIINGINFHCLNKYDLERIIDAN